MKKSLFCASLVLIACSLSCNPHFPNHLQDTKLELSPSNVIFAFDIHDVLAQPSYAQRSWQLCSFKGLELAGKMAVAKLFGYQTELSQRFKQGEGRSSEGLAALFEDDPAMAETIKDLGNTYNATPEMKELVKRLSDAGYELIVASDIGPEMYERMKAKEDTAELFSLFRKAHVVSYQGHASFDAATQTNIAAHQKPAQEFFTAFDNRFNPDQKIVIFVDDKQANIDAAVAHGWIGIQFNATEQLKAALEELNVIHA